jgi:hypothetical protein
MRVRSSELAAEASHEGFYNDRDTFFRRGSTEQWHEVLGDEELPRYIARVAECAPADLAAWIDPALTTRPDLRHCRVCLVPSRRFTATLLATAPPQRRRPLSACEPCEQQDAL